MEAADRQQELTPVWTMLARSDISPAMVKVMSLESNRLASSESLALGKVEHAEGVHVQLDERRRRAGELRRQLRRAG